MYLEDPQGGQRYGGGHEVKGPHSIHLNAPDVCVRSCVFVSKAGRGDVLLLHSCKSKRKISSKDRRCVIMCSFFFFFLALLISIK